MEIIGYCTIWLLSLVGGSIWRGYIFSILWAWFIVPTFAASAINIPQAIGLAIIASYLQPSRYKKDKRSIQERTAELVGVSFLGPLLVLGFAAIVKHWM